MSRTRGEGHSCARRGARTVVLPVVGQTEQKADASRRSSRDETVEGDEEALVVRPGSGLQRALALPPLVLERPQTKDVQTQARRLVQHLLDPGVLVGPLVGAAGVRQVVAVGARDAERGPVRRIDETAALGGDDAARGSVRALRRDGDEGEQNEGDDGGETRTEETRGTRGGGARERTSGGHRGTRHDDETAPRGGRRGGRRGGCRASWSATSAPKKLGPNTKARRPAGCPTEPGFSSGL